MSYASSSSSSSSSHDDKRGTETEDWINLPCPTKYEDITREAISKLLQLQNLHTSSSSTMSLLCIFEIPSSSSRAKNASIADWAKPNR